MKLRYYLRGLAVGIVLATLVLTISNAGNRPLTDAQIRQRAAELGMVEEDSLKLSMLQSETADSASEAQSPESKPAESMVTESRPAESDSAESKPVESAAAEQVKAITIQIKSGANSYTVSKDLAAAGLVEDARAYDTFLCNNGYSKKIHVGTYEILPGTSEEEIAKMIAY